MPVNMSLPMEELVQLLSDNWVTGNSTTPTYFIKLNTDNHPVVVDTRRGSAVIGRPATTSFDIEPIGNWNYGNLTYSVGVELKSSGSRQVLYDMVWEIKRILFNNKHAMTNFQRVQFEDFNEEEEANINMWSGTIQVGLQNAAVKLDTT